jgi:ribosome-binding ATPase YchF (GTP1/OBG family)
MQMPRESQVTRLDRIEDKIDKMAEAIIHLARVEEKIADLEERREEQHERLNRLSTKLDSIEKHVTAVVEKVGVLQKINWLIVSAFITAIATDIILP